MPQAVSYIEPSTLKRLSVRNPWRTGAAIAFDWAVIAAAIWIGTRYANPFVYLATITVIAGRMHALAILVHDFAHYRFIASKQGSDWFGDLVLAWPLLITVGTYRQNHLAHHRYTNTDKDPDWVVKIGTIKFTFPQDWRVAAINLVGYLVAISGIADLIMAFKRLRAYQQPSRGYVAARFGFYALALGVLIATGTWPTFVMFWLVPYITLFFLALYVRSVAEHFGSMEYEDELTDSRTVLPYWWERILFAPHNVNHHLEHHLYPSVPYFNLGELHRELMKSPDFAARAHITRGYSTGLVKECVIIPERDRKTTPHPAE